MEKRNQGPNLGPAPQVDPTTLDEFVCGMCGSRYFQPAIKLKLVPGLLSRSGRDEVAMLQDWKCLGCGTVGNQKIVPSQEPKPEPAEPKLQIVKN